MTAFEILGVTPTDDFATIRRAWIRLVKANHPDVAGGDPVELTRKLTELNEAYDALRWHSPEKVRIRKKQSTQKGPSAKPGRTTSDGGQRDQGRKSAQSRRTDQNGRCTEPPKAGPKRPDRQDRRRQSDCPESNTKFATTPPASASWDILSAADRFSQVQTICASDALTKAARNRRCV